MPDISRQKAIDAATARQLSALDASCFDRPYGEADFAAMMATGNYELLAAREKGRLVGFAVATSSEPADVVRIAVAPTWRKKGIGRTLLNRLDAKRCLAEVKADDRGLAAFYGRCGFTVVAKRPNYYGAGRSAWLMERKI